MRGKLREMPTCQQQPVLGDPLNWLEQVVLEGQISTAGAHLKGKGIQSKHKLCSKEQGTPFRCPGSQILNSQQLRKGVHGETLFILTAAAMLRLKTANSPHSSPSPIDESFKSLTHWENLFTAPSQRVAAAVCTLGQLEPMPIRGYHLGEPLPMHSQTQTNPSTKRTMHGPPQIRWLK